MSEAASTTTPETTAAPAAADPAAAPAPETTPVAPPPAADPPPAQQPTEAAPADGFAELKLPEGFELNEAVFGDFKAAAAELKLPTLGAQKLLDLYVTAKQAETAAWNDQVEGWRRSVETDPVIGGPNKQATLQAAGRAMARYGTPELRKLLDATGIGNHPDLVRAFARIGGDLAEDTLLTTARGQVEPDPLRAMYPNSPGMFQ